MATPFGARPCRTLRARIMRGDEDLPVVAKHPHHRQRIIATPDWADFQRIREVYKEADRLSALHGIPYSVDHDIPLNHPRVCGLHVHNNLKPSPLKANMSKGNKWCPEQLELFEDNEQLRLF